MNEYSINISANIVAWYGAIIASVGMFLSIYTIIRDSAKIKIRVSKDNRIYGGPSFYDSNKTYLNISVINKGRRPVNIAKAGYMLYFGKKPYVIASDSFADYRNKVLTEEKPNSEFLVEQDNIEVKNIYYYWAQDATGKIYRKYSSKTSCFIKGYYWLRKK